MFEEVFASFVDESPVSVMFRGTLENIFSAERLDQIFAENAQKQLQGTLAFSTCADMLGLVTTRIQPSINAAYQKKIQEIGVSIKSVYNKLNGVEPQVSQALVEQTAADLSLLVTEMGATQPGPLAGYDVRIVDGNHIGATDRRIKELRNGAPPLPGHTVAVLNPAVELIESLIVCEDGHASQKPLYVELLEQVRRGQCWIGDRDYATMEFLFGFRQRDAHFIIRQHGSVKGQLIGKRQRVGETETGVVYEQQIRLKKKGQEDFVMRRITVHLFETTRDGDVEVHLLTNLPASIEAPQIADAYRSRWTIETAFAKLTKDLKCELKTLGYPKAALFSFCVAVVMYNALSTVIAALRAAHPEVPTGAARKSGADQTFSFYYLADEISGMARGMSVAIPTESWTAAFAPLTTEELARKLVFLAKRVKVKQFLTNRYSKQNRTRKKRTSKAKHVSTSRILDERGKLRTRT